MDHQRSSYTAKTPGIDRSALSLSFTAVLLVGGESRRMGSDKALLCPTGEPLWSRQLKLLGALQPQYTWISARTVPTWCPAAIEVVLDVPPSRGPLSGICACLERLETSHMIVLAIDLPRMTATHLLKLSAMIRPGRSLIPLNGDYFEPLCALYSKSCQLAAANLLGSTDNSLQGLAKRLLDDKLAESYPLDSGEKSLYLNLNRPEDISAI